MPLAVAVIETQTFPAMLVAADAMVKAGRVTVAKYEQADSGRQFVSIRGPVSEVKMALEAGLAAANACPGVGEAITYILIPNPQENVEGVLPIHYCPAAEPFRV